MQKTVPKSYASIQTRWEQPSVSYEYYVCCVQALYCKLHSAIKCQLVFGFQFCMLYLLSWFYYSFSILAVVVLLCMSLLLLWGPCYISCVSFGAGIQLQTAMPRQIERRHWSWFATWCLMCSTGRWWTPSQGMLSMQQGLQLPFF